MATVRYLVNDVDARCRSTLRSASQRRIAAGYLSQLWKRAISSYG